MSETTTLLVAVATPLFGFSSACLVHLYKHGNRLSTELSTKEQRLTDLIAAHTDCMVQNAKLTVERDNLKRRLQDLDEERLLALASLEEARTQIESLLAEIATMKEGQNGTG